MNKNGRYPIRKNFRIRKDQAEWLLKQPNDESETIRRLIDKEMEGHEKNVEAGSTSGNGQPIKQKA